MSEHLRRRWNDSRRSFVMMYRGPTPSLGRIHSSKRTAVVRGELERRGNNHHHLALSFATVGVIFAAQPCKTTPIHSKRTSYSPLGGAPSSYYSGGAREGRLLGCDNDTALLLLLFHHRDDFRLPPSRAGPKLRCPPRLHSVRHTAKRRGQESRSSRVGLSILSHVRVAKSAHTGGLSANPHRWNTIFFHSEAAPLHQWFRKGASARAEGSNNIEVRASRGNP